MTPDKACYDFIKAHEGCILHAYKDSVGVWTIGYGTIKYPDGRLVKKGDQISQQQAEELLQYEVNMKAKVVDEATNMTPLAQNQFNALVSFTYNVGTKAFLSSSLLKLLRANPYNPEIEKSFLLWSKGHINGKLVTIPGLLKRRKEEAFLYFTSP